MLKSFTSFTRPSTFKVLTGFLSPGRHYSAAKDEGNGLFCFKLTKKLIKSYTISAPKGESKDEAKKSEVEELELNTLKIEKTGNITLIGINRAEVRNCINSFTAQLLSAEIEKFENDPESPVAILYGVGGNFCAGYDLNELKESEAGLILKSEGAMVRIS